MTLEELTEQRRSRWFAPVATLDDAREFLTGVGFCLLYPVRPSVLAPSLIGGILGAGVELPDAKHAAVDPRSGQADEVVQRLLAEKSAFEVNFGDKGSLLVAAPEFPYFYALVGDRNPKQPPAVGVHSEKTLIAHTFTALQKEPLDEPALLERVGKAVSEAALHRALHWLWSKLRVVRHPRPEQSGQGWVWQLTHQWTPDLVQQGIQLSTGEALSALLTRYLTTVVAAEPREIEEFFGNVTARSRVVETIKALAAAREVETIQIEGRRCVRLTLPSVEMKHPAGRAPVDLHASHQQNERKRHTPRPPRRVPGR